MSITRCRHFALQLFCGSLPVFSLAYGLTADAANTPNSTSKTEPVVTVSSPVSQEIFPQIARISYVEGDVRIARGKEAERTTHASWETAVNDLPVETGFSLATGAGRAEIEFEDASTVYLAENSVLTFNDLHSQAGIPYTELALLTGTATMHVRPESAQERFVVHTPADTVRFNYPVSADIRVRSADGCGQDFVLSRWPRCHRGGCEEHRGPCGMGSLGSEPGCRTDSRDNRSDEGSWPVAADSRPGGDESPGNVLPLRALRHVLGA
jgi:hypothetical protein